MRYIRIDVENGYFQDHCYISVADATSDGDIDARAEAIAHSVAENYTDAMSFIIYDYRVSMGEDLDEDDEREMILELEANYWDSLEWNWEEISDADYRMNTDLW